MPSVGSTISPSRSLEGSSIAQQLVDPGRYRVFSKVSVRVLQTFPPKIQVFVMDSSHQSKPYAMGPDDSSRDLKENTEEAGGPYVEGKLCDQHSLSDLHLKDCDTITLIKRGHKSP